MAALFPRIRACPLSLTSAVCAVDAFAGQGIPRQLLATPSGRWTDPRRASRRAQNPIIAKDPAVGGRFMRLTPWNGSPVMRLSSSRPEERTARGSVGVSGEPGHGRIEGKPSPPTRKASGSFISPTNLSPAWFRRTPRGWYRGWRDLLQRASRGGSMAFVAIALLAASLPQVDTKPPMGALGDSLSSSGSDRRIGRQTASVTSDNEVPRGAAPVGYDGEGQESAIGASDGRRRDVASDARTISPGKGSDSLRNSDLAQSIVSGGPRQAGPLTHGF